MQPYKIALFLLPTLLISTACSEQGDKTTAPDTVQPNPAYVYKHPIPFAPEQYVCYRASQSIQIDGKLTETDWQQAPATADFVDIEGSLQPAPAHASRAWMLWDDQYFYVAAQMEEPHIWAKLTKRDTVIFYDDDFEVFIDPDGDGHNYYEFEMNALNTVWDLLLLRPYRVDQRTKVLDNWDINGLRSAVHIAGTINDPSDTDDYWTVEIAFPWSALKELADTPVPPDDHDQWRVGFSRVDWVMDMANGGYRKRLRADGQKPLAESNWVWSAQGRIAMHQPETWGYVQFTTQPLGEGPVTFQVNREEEIKWALWQLHYQQVAFREGEGRYARSTAELILPQVDIENYAFDPTLEPYTGGYRISVPALADDHLWIIDETARIWKMKKDAL